MKAVEANLLEFIQKSMQFVIPIYQRTYSWTPAECKQLWQDIIQAGRDDAISAHFVGSIVYIEKGLYQVVGHKPLLVIDGQQRLTTVTLLIAALERRLASLPEAEQEPFEGFSPKRLRNRYLVDPEEKGEKHFKLLLSQTDKDTLIAIIAGRDLPAAHSVRVAENFKEFEKLIAECGTDLLPLCRGLAKLLIVDIALTRGQDNPQLIFESMNSTGKELSQADLIRNFVLMGLEQDLQTRLYEEYWRPMEIGFGQAGYVEHFDSFMRHYLTVKTGTIPNLRAIYDEFKKFSGPPLPSRIEELVREVRQHAKRYCAMALPDVEPDPELRTAFADLRELTVDVAYPCLLELYTDYEAGKLPRADFLKAVRLIEAYVFRRAVCAIPANSMNKTFATFCRTLDKERYLDSIQAQFLRLPSYRRMPDDDEFRRQLVVRDLYNFGTRRSYWLRRLENHDRRERAAVTEYTIEHIMPQNEDLSPAWQDTLGPEWQRVHKTYLHTLGNLTLTGYNSEYSDKPFIAKRDMEGGFGMSPLKLNKGLGQLSTWNEQTISERAQRLADRAVGVWAVPALDAALMNTQVGHAGGPAVLTVEAHEHLARAPIRALFDALRREVLSLDACVVEEVYLTYIAYKAETNFVDVMPQASRLRLVLNMEFAEIEDPRRICRDVSNVGHIGNGDVEVGLTALSDLNYVVGLIRQSFERQMDKAT